MATVGSRHGNERTQSGHSSNPDSTSRTDIFLMLVLVSPLRKTARNAEREFLVREDTESSNGELMIVNDVP